MTTTLISWAVVLSVSLFSLGSAHAQTPPADVPREIAAMLKEHLGRWRSEGTFSMNGVSQPAKATWECVAAVGGVGVVCTWIHEWADGRTDKALDVLGYDPVANAITGTRITDRGVVNPPTLLQVRGNTMISTWTGEQADRRNARRQLDTAHDGRRRRSTDDRNDDDALPRAVTPGQ